ncbi:MAG: TonB-dependent receptor, partial [Bacteroidales bacterium]
MIKRNTLSILFIFFAALCMAAPTSLTIKGRVIDKLTGEGLPYSNVYIENSTTGTMTTDDGSFSLEIPTTNQSLNLIAKNLGYRVVKRKIGDLKSVENILFELEEDVLAVEEVVVSANRNEVSRKLAPTVVNVLSAKQFDMVNACDLSQSLPFKSGVRVENNCQNCGFPQVRINGLEGPYTQILIDSRPVVSSLSGVYGLEQIPTNMIERVEVLRGGGSALYGSNAIAGVVNIITKDPVQNSFMVNTDIQSTDKGTMQELVTANASLVAKNNKAGLALFQSYRNRSPYDRDGDGFSEVGKLSATNF